MISTQDLEGSSSLEMALPPGFEKIEELMTMPSERLKKSPLVNVIGLVKDYQPPIPTKGSDYKCTLFITDLSTQNDFDGGIKVSIFWREDKMPHITGVRDIVLLRKFKVQMWNGFVSLLANLSSDIQVFPATKMTTTLIPITILSKSTPPSPAEARYAAWLFHNIDNSTFPEAKEFEVQSINAMNVKDKYSLLKDIKAGHFYDLIGEVIRVHETDGRMTLYLSDYTAHTLFYNNVWGEGDTNPSNQDGDEYGYMKSKRKASNDWPGPFGKLSIQITVWDPHAAYIREQVRNGDWVILSNVYANMGNRGGCIEGFLREDPKAFTGKVQVQIIRRAEDAERNDARWKACLRRKKEWWEKFKKQKQAFLEESKGMGKMHKLKEPENSKMNNKKRRKEKRVAIEHRVVSLESKTAGNLGLNTNVKCIHPDKPPISLATILNTTKLVKSQSGSEYVLAFENVNYRSNVRVVDFWPNELEAFAVGRKASEYEVLSDYSGGETTDTEKDMRLFREGKGYGGQKTWEWRFALCVKDADKKDGDQQDTIWLVVDNQAAQMLLNIDAVNLRKDERALTMLREILFTLWGDLEEKKTTYLSKRNSKAQKSAEVLPKPFAAAPNSKAIRSKPADDLPPDSDDDDGVNHSREISSSSTADVQGSHSELGTTDTEYATVISSLPIVNKGFTCCIKQYGIRVPEKSASKCDAGNGHRWKRMFGLFGTTIV